MITRRLDRALEAMHACRLRTPDMREVFGPNTPQWEALTALMAALDYAERSLQAPAAGAPSSISAPRA